MKERFSLGNLFSMEAERDTLDILTEEKGLPYATKNVTETLRRGRVQSIFEGPAKDVLTTAGGIVIGNHNGVEDPRALLAALPNRKDIHVIGTPENISLYGPVAQKYLIEVDSSKQPTSKWSTRFKRFVEQPLDNSGTINIKNAQAIVKATRLVANGALIVLFPEGEQGGGSDWLRGVGEIALRVKEKTSQKSFLTFAYIDGTSFFDRAKLMPGVNRVSPFRANVIFSAPREINKMYTDGINSYALTYSLQQQYKDWCKSLGLE